MDRIDGKVPKVTITGADQKKSANSTAKKVADLAADRQKAVGAANDAVKLVE